MQPPAPLNVLADPIYEAFYGLTEQPFATTTDPKFFYSTGSHERAFSEISNGLRRREGVLLLTGDTGTGKTTLCRAVLDSLGKRTFSAMILNPYMSGAEVFRIIVRDFGLVTHEELRRGALATADTAQLIDTLEGFLRSLVSLDSHAVIVVDEAQSVAPQVLDQIRLLTAFEHNGKRLVQIVLCGQPSLVDTLASPSLQALSERITRRVALQPLTREQVASYIHHRLAIAGGTESVRFDAGAVRLIAEISNGLPRRVNVMCDRALQEGRIEGAGVITTDLAKRAARSISGDLRRADIAPPPPVAPEEPRVTDDVTEIAESDQSRVNRRGLYAALVGIVVALAAGGYVAYAMSVVDPAGPLTPPADRPMKQVGALVPAVTRPSDEEVRLRGLELRGPRPSAQLPDNSNQLDGNAAALGP